MNLRNNIIINLGTKLDPKLPIELQIADIYKSVQSGVMATQYLHYALMEVHNVYIRRSSKAGDT